MYAESYYVLLMTIWINREVLFDHFDQTNAVSTSRTMRRQREEAVIALTKVLYQNGNV